MTSFSKAETTRFTKTFSDGLDAMEIEGHAGSDWVTIQMTVGNSGQTVTIILRTREMASDLHYALGRYLQWKG